VTNIRPEGGELAGGGEADPSFDMDDAMSEARLKPLEVRRTFSKRLSFARTPSLLCLQIQRLFGEVKNSRFVPFPLKLDFGSFIAPMTAHSESQPCSCQSCSAGFLRTKVEAKGNGTYSLRAVVVHLGVSNSGHFITYRRIKKNSSPAAWYYVSDEQVRPCAVSEVLGAEAYLLFYELEHES